jgi:hypothetical protein
LASLRAFRRRRAGQQAQQPAPERSPERLDLGLGETQEEVAEEVIAGKTLQTQQGLQDVVGAQPAS